MTVRQTIGWAPLVSPFVGIFIMAAHDNGLMFALGLFGATCALAALISLGVSLAFDE